MDKPVSASDRSGVYRLFISLFQALSVGVVHRSESLTSLPCALVQFITADLLTALFGHTLTVPRAQFPCSPYT